MLKSFFGSKTRVKLLGLFLLHPKNEYFIRELTRSLKEQINSIRRELNNLKKIGLLKSYTKNRKKYFYLNEEFSLVNELKAMFAKVEQPNRALVERVASLGAVDFLLLSGQFVGKKSEVDVLVVGELDRAALKKGIEENVDGKKVKYVVMSLADFLYRLDCRDAFTLGLVSDRSNLTPINGIKKYIDARTKTAAR